MGNFQKADVVSKLTAESKISFQEGGDGRFHEEMFRHMIKGLEKSTEDTVSNAELLNLLEATKDLDSYNEDGYIKPLKGIGGKIDVAPPIFLSVFQKFNNKVRNIFDLGGEIESKEMDFGLMMSLLGGQSSRRNIGRERYSPISNRDEVGNSIQEVKSKMSDLSGSKNKNRRKSLRDNIVLGINGLIDETDELDTVLPYVQHLSDLYIGHSVAPKRKVFNKLKEKFGYDLRYRDGFIFVENDSNSKVYLKDGEAINLDGNISKFLGINYSYGGFFVMSDDGVSYKTYNQLRSNDIQLNNEFSDAKLSFAFEGGMKCFCKNAGGDWKLYQISEEDNKLALVGNEVFSEEVVASKSR